MKHQLEYRHLRYFMAVAEELHFRKAAERLFISQPGLSRQIRDLEETLGVILFERNNRNVQLTPAGNFLKKELKRHFVELDHMITQAKLLHEGSEGSLRFGYVGSAMHLIIPELLASFRQKFPKVHFSLKEMDNQDQIDGLHSHEIDIGFVRFERVPGSLETVAVLNEAFCLVLPKDHPLEPDNFKDISQVKEESFILFDSKYSPSYYEKVMRIFDDGGFSPIVSHNTIHSTSIYKLVEKKFGISIVPRSLLSGHHPEIKFIELNTIPHRTTLSAVWRRDEQSPLLRNFLAEVNKLKKSLERKP
ncbi:MAG: LysR family transcriptional regulator [Bacteroidia bacterium]|nr:LysR family transcriptional regulator [Bacteroidia bacterium]